jgi:hypothetical protein
MFEELLGLFFLKIATFLAKLNLPHVSLSNVAAHRNVFSIVITFFLIIPPNYNHHEINCKEREAEEEKLERQSSK